MSSPEEDIIIDLKLTVKEILNEMVSPILLNLVGFDLSLIDKHKEKILNWLRRNKQKIAEL